MDTAAQLQMAAEDKDPVATSTAPPELPKPTGDEYLVALTPHGQPLPVYPDEDEGQTAPEPQPQTKISEGFWEVKKEVRETYKAFLIAIYLFRLTRLWEIKSISTFAGCRCTSADLHKFRNENPTLRLHPLPKVLFPRILLSYLLPLSS